MARSGHFALVINEAAPSRFQYTLLEAIDAACEIYLFRDVKTSNPVYSSAHQAWFAGYDALQAHERKNNRNPRSQPSPD
jgi:poly(3-hydroxyalkanoate) synthetase